MPGMAAAHESPCKQQVSAACFRRVGAPAKKPARYAIKLHCSAIWATCAPTCAWVFSAAVRAWWVQGAVAVPVRAPQGCRGARDPGVPEQRHPAQRSHCSHTGEDVGGARAVVWVMGLAGDWALAMVAALLPTLRLARVGWGPQRRAEQGPFWGSQIDRQADRQAAGVEAARRHCRRAAAPPADQRSI